MTCAAPFRSRLVESFRAATGRERCSKRAATGRERCFKRAATGRERLTTPNDAHRGPVGCDGEPEPRSGSCPGRWTPCCRSLVPTAGGHRFGRRLDRRQPPRAGTGTPQAIHPSVRVVRGECHRGVTACYNHGLHARLGDVHPSRCRRRLRAAGVRREGDGAVPHSTRKPASVPRTWLLYGGR